MAIFWSSKGDRVKRLLVRRCSHSAQQRQREQLNRDAGVDAAIERVKRDAIVHKGGKFGCTPIRESVTPGPSTFPRRTQCQRENGPGKRLRRFCLSGRWRFFGSSERPPVSEDPKTDQVAHWRWRFFGSRGKKTTGGSDLNVSPPSDGLTKRRKCVSAAAASSGFARVQDRANVVKAARRQRAFTWLFGLLHSKACLCMCPPDHATSGLASDSVYFAAR